MASDVFEDDPPLLDDGGDDPWDDDAGMPVLELIDEMAPLLDPRDDQDDDDDDDGDASYMPELIPKLDILSEVSAHQISEVEDETHQNDASTSFLYYTEAHEESTLNLQDSVSGNDSHLSPQKLMQGNLSTDTHVQKLSSKSKSKDKVTANFTELIEKFNQSGSRRPVIRDVKIVVSKLPCFMCNLCRIWYIRAEDLQKHNREHHSDCKARQNDTRNSDNWLKRGFDSNNNDVIVQDRDGKLHMSGKAEGNITSSRPRRTNRVIFADSLEAFDKQVYSNGEGTGEIHRENGMEIQSTYHANIERYFKSLEKSSCDGHLQGQGNDKGQGTPRGQGNVELESNGVQNSQTLKSIMKVKGSGRVEEKSRVKGQDMGNKKEGHVGVGKNQVQEKVGSPAADTKDTSRNSTDNTSVKRKKSEEKERGKDQEKRGGKIKKHASNSVHKDAFKYNKIPHSKYSMESPKKKQKTGCNTCHQDKCSCRKDGNKSPEINKFKCTKCTLKFESQHSLDSHLKFHDGVDKCHQCEVCNKSFVTNHELTVHRSQHVDRPYKCEFCAKTFLQQRPYKLHINKDHSNGNSVLCPLCGARFLNLSQLNSHRQIHIKDLPYLCQHCPQQFPELNELKKHMMGPKHKDVKEEDWGLEQCYVYKHLTKLKHEKRRLIITKDAVPVPNKQPLEIVDLT